MDWNDTPEQAAFRDQVRSVIEQRLPARYQALAEGAHEGERQWEFDRKSEDPEARQAANDWAAALSEQGWVAPHWPSEYGGAGLSVTEQFVFRQEMAEHAAPAVGGSGVSLLGPTLIVHGTEEQRQKYLPPILAQTSRRSRRVPSAMAMSGWSTGKRSGSQERMQQTRSSLSCEPSPTRRSTEASLSS